ncbi:MAG: MFS transporter [Acidobacteria bacterium]|nr:MFS transporter [Acidobacteriota bacterium]
MPGGLPGKGSPSISARLGWVSFLNDASSEVVARALPLLLVHSLGLSPFFLGWVEGLAESAAILLKGLSGWVSDTMRSRKPLVLAGYTLSVLARSLYLLGSLPLLLGSARILDRIGKGLRGGPRDAMVADAAATGGAGRAFGITRFLDTLGAMTGIALVLGFGLGPGPMDPATFRACAWVALPLGLSALTFLLVCVPSVPRAIQAGRRLGWRVPPTARGYLIIVLVFALASSSDAFLVLKAREAGFGFRETLGLFLLFNGLAAALAIPAGRLSDRLGRTRFLLLGWGVYALAYAAMGFSDGRAPFAAALLGYGAFYGLTEGVEKALLADLLPPAERGAGFGAFQATQGLGALLASPLMGAMAAAWGSRVAFAATAGLAFLAMLLLLGWALRRRHTSK